jgi:osmotically-inducible protein OsmY
MKSQLIQALTATLALAAASIAGAQSFGPLPPSQEQAPSAAQELAAQATASATRTDGPNGEIADRIVKEFNADASFQGSKVTVAPDADSITLTGVTRTREQAKKAYEIAAGIAGELRVINAIQAENV